ncbi:hypothetical protein K438DRAFT_1859998 [Mycena galopus ATCC 62051]|nr:hypothetical protein K438DRAFT_1859998 [Mycena galopus ATCC 62051]
MQSFNSALYLKPTLALVLILSASRFLKALDVSSLRIPQALAVLEPTGDKSGTTQVLPHILSYFASMVRPLAASGSLRPPNPSIHLFAPAHSPLCP